MLQRLFNKMGYEKVSKAEALKKELGTLEIRNQVIALQIEDDKKKLEKDIISIKIEDFEFDTEHKETIGLFLKSHSFGVVKKYLVTQLMNLMYQSEVDESFKNGWKSCIRAMADMPVASNPEEEEEDDSNIAYIDEI